MKYTVYITPWIESLQDAKVIAEVDTYDAAWRAIDDFLKENHFRKEKYCRFLLGKDAMFIDFGSWSTFAAISPVPKEVFG